MSGISTHVLDTSLGLPAAGVHITLERQAPDDYATLWFPCASATTDSDGRCRPLLPPEEVKAGKHRITFAVERYFAATQRATLYPEVIVTFTVAQDGDSYHIPLLLSPFGYSTYRGT